MKSTADSPLTCYFVKKKKHLRSNFQTVASFLMLIVVAEKGSARAVTLPHKSRISPAQAQCFILLSIYISFESVFSLIQNKD